MAASRQVGTRIRSFFAAPVLDFLAAFARVLPDPPYAAMALVFVGFGLSWWVYVPAHELLHAFGCLAAGGSVDRLEIDPQYGAALLQKVFPFVAVGSDYAGQLTGFDTHGSDGTYLITVFAPFLLTVLFGVPLLRRLTRVTRPGRLSSFLFGLSVPVALAPFTNLNGDYYEMGSIVTSRLARLLGSEVALERWRSDDLAKTLGELASEGTFHFADAAGILVGAVLGLLLALATYALGTGVSQLLDYSRRPSGRAG